jgi:serine/threonine-protein kinase
MSIAPSGCFACSSQWVNFPGVAQQSFPEVRIVGRYALYDEIASGGMATVHIGRLLGPVGFSRTVAIKRLHRQYAREPEFVSMFLDEARLAARIRHPNVVGTLDVVSLDGELFLVMEYVQGESLVRLLRAVRERGEGVPIPIAASILVGVLEGLHAAHEATNDQGEPLGIVHRDVSPQNILVGTDGVARVLDFGVAKAAGRVQSTRDGQLKGKLGYMAPEQIAGNATRATDVHAASVVLWEMLTGRRLYHGENELQTYANILAGSAVPPSTYAPSVGAELEKLVLQGLSPNPSARFASAREMARALQRTTLVASASDVGDWVQAVAGPEMGARAQKIAAIESTPARAIVASPESVEHRSPSHPPVSVEPQHGSRSRLVLALAVMVTLALGAAMGVYLRPSGPSSTRSAAGHAGAENAVIAPQSPSTPAVATPVALATAVPAHPSPAALAREAGPARSQPPERWSLPQAPAKQPPPVPSAESDFTHVMDSRK